MKKYILAVMLVFVVSPVFACECPIKTKDHVAPVNTTVMDTENKLIIFTWHCGYVKSVSGECGKWEISIRTCEGKRIKGNYSYLKILNSRE